MRLRIRDAQGSRVLDLNNKPDDQLTLQDLLSQIGAPVTAMKLGFPPKHADLSDPNRLLSHLGIKNGEQLTIESTSGQTVQRQQQDQIDETTVPCDNGSYLTLRVMEDDNSCLFRSIGYAFSKQLDSMAELRSIVAESIRRDPVTYNDAILGKPVDEYIRWIKKPQSWGGGIELNILSQHFAVTIYSLDVQTLRLDKFNPGMEKAIVVVYSGIHYDAVALVPFARGATSPAELDVSVFSAEQMDGPVGEALLLLGKKLQKAHYYTDTASFSVKCNICLTPLKGEKEALQHAKSTGHADFGEV